MLFPASGFGEQSKYFDDVLLFDGTYQVISVTMDSSSRDVLNTSDPTILRKGLLIAPTTGYSGRYTPLSTADDFLNGSTPTQFIGDVLVLAREEHTLYAYILGNNRRRTIDANHRIVPAYIACNIFSPKILYNNKSILEITDSQWESCQRIKPIDAGKSVYDLTEDMVRALLWKRIETTVSELDFN